MELNEKGLRQAAMAIAGDTSIGQMHRASEIAATAITAYLSTTLPADLAGLVERLLDISQNDDHVRGCEGRQYTCSCGFDDRTYKTCDEAASTITALSAEVERLGRERDDWKAWRKQHHSDLLTAERDLATAKAALEVKDRALETVGRYADYYDGIPDDRKHFGDTDFTMHHPNAEWVNVSLGDLRRARAARAHGGDHAE